MSQVLTRLRALLPLIVFVATVGLGWVLLGGPAASDSTRIAGQIAALRQREAALQAVVNEPPPSSNAPNPVAAFDARMSADDPTAATVERLARLASEVRARALFIETVDSATATGRSGASVALSSQPDPRFALFDRQLTSTTIRLSFETRYAGLGQFLWNLRGGGSGSRRRRPRRSSTAGRMTRPGCSTPAARPDGPRAPPSRTATCS
jgi:hypothetical protein